MDDISITLVQPDIFWEDHKRNARHLTELLSNVKGTDLILLPEMFSSGFTMDPKSAALEEGGDMVDWMKDLAEEKHCWVMGSLCVSQGGKFYNRLYAISSSGIELIADKRHLFSLAGEEKIYEKGSSRECVWIKGWKVFPLVCYDLRFPVWSRNDLEYDLLTYVANWPHRRIQAWDTLLPARAVENQAYVAAVNRVGSDGNGVEHSGHSSAYDPLGEKILELPEGKESVKTVILKAEHLKKTREKFQFLGDRDHFNFVDDPTPR